MAHVIAIPKLGLTMTDCTLVEWAKQTGDKVAKGEVLYTIETDKISSDIEADADGFLQRIAALDTLLEVGALVGYLHETKEATEQVPPDVTSVAQAIPVAEHHSAPPAPAEPTVRADGRAAKSRRLISPLAKRMAQQAGLDIHALTGTGPGAVILKRDVEKAIGQGVAATVPVAQAQAAFISPAVASLHAPEPQRRPLAGMRKAIANRMMQSLQGSAQMTAFGRIDMSEAVKLRAACIEAEQSLGARLTYTDIVLKAAAMTLAEMPEINASIIGDEIVTWSEVHMGLAVGLDDGLIVPVIHNADKKSLVEISRSRQDLIGRARAGKLTRQDLDGGTFSLSNFGSYGGDFETPILNPPQSALLGIGQITDEPVVRDGAIVIRPMMTISMTFDHRLIDGAVAGRFRSRFKTFLEKPAILMASLR